MANGNVYEGDFRDNCMHGFGRLIQKKGTREYIGEWANNKMNGKGLYQWEDGRSYKGEYLNDKKHGYGEYTWADGRQYLGMWALGK